VIAVDPDDPRLCPDPREFSAARWVRLDDVLEEPIKRLDPHTHRFVRKLRAAGQATPPVAATAMRDTPAGENCYCGPESASLGAESCCGRPGSLT
jgi:hypothetical protein